MTAPATQHTPLLSVLIPMRTKNPLNGSQGRTLNGRRARDAQRKAQRMHVVTMMHGNVSAVVDLVRRGHALVITLTRIAPRAVSDEAIAATLKAVRDGVADWLGIDDDDPRLTWVYRQEKGAAKRKGKPAEYAVRVEVE